MEEKILNENQKENQKNNEDKIIKRINNLIEIKYLFNSNVIYQNKPTFTHQLFENENIQIPLKLNEIKVEIEININNLQSNLIVYNSNEEITNEITQKIDPLLSNDTFEWIFDRFEPQDTFTIQNEKQEENEEEKEKENIEFYLLTQHDRGAGELLSRAEKIAMWYIETASSIDFNDDKWEVVYIVKRIGEQKMFVGYCTLYTFHNPFLGSKIRICQVLILPPFQGHGYGRKLLLFIYNLAASRSNISEITVEDPAEGFQNLRDLVDMEWYLQLHIQKQKPLPELKLTSGQLHFVQNCFEFHKLSLLSLSLDDQNQNLTLLKKRTIEEAEGNIGVNKISQEKEVEYRKKLKDFRLGNKRYLLQQNGDLRGLEKEKMQKELGELYDELEKRFIRVEKKFKNWNDYL